MTLLLLIELVQVDCLRVMRLLLLLLDLVHKLPDFGLQTLGELSLHLGVIDKFGLVSLDLEVQLLTSTLTFSHEGLVLFDIVLEVIKDIQFLVKCNQSVQLVLQLHLFLLEQELKLGVFSLLEHDSCEALLPHG